MARVPARGLADVVAASTALSEIDGQVRRLSYRGYDINELASVAAHVIEQHADNRLIRPDSEYIGERGQRWVPPGAR